TLRDADLVTLQLFDCGQGYPRPPTGPYLFPSLRSLHIYTGYHGPVQPSSRRLAVVNLRELLQSLIPSVTGLRDLRLVIRPPTAQAVYFTDAVGGLLEAAKDTLHSLTLAYLRVYGPRIPNTLRKFLQLQSYSEISCDCGTWGNHLPLDSLPDSVTSYTIHHSQLASGFPATADLCTKIGRTLAFEPAVLPNLVRVTGVILDTSTILATDDTDRAHLALFDSPGLLRRLLAARPNIRSLPQVQQSPCPYPVLSRWEP
ncbi:hypothetical protein P7C70_g9263, partial [Phenoliferia sp. Uapishka_3]